MMVDVGFNPRASPPHNKARRVATIEGSDRRDATGVFFYFQFQALKRPATFIGHSVTNSINYESTIDHL
jgi:hypothetical protein